MGAIPTGVKAPVRGLGSKVCTGCMAAIETVHHLFLGCLCLNYLSMNLCNWIGKVQNICISCSQLITMSWGKQAKAIDSILALLCFCYLKSTWNLKNARLFQGAIVHACFFDLLQSYLATWWTYKFAQVIPQSGSNYNGFCCMVINIGSFELRVGLRVQSLKSVVLVLPCFSFFGLAPLS